MNEGVFKLLVAIPHYNHADTVFDVVRPLQAQGMDCLVVDDGSSAEARAKLAAFKPDGVEVIYRPNNGGKGAALKNAFYYAAMRGYTHVLQVDADGQHDLADAMSLLQLAKDHPADVICAQPVYGDDAPKSRLQGRKITNFWVSVNTLSRDIKDAMCGFRVYPVASVIPLIENYFIGNRMDFDVDIVVRLHRMGLTFRWLPSQVRYAQDGVSHFRLWGDNIALSRMHSRLFFSMLMHFPKMLWRNVERTRS